MRQYETYYCNACGNEVEVQNVGGGKLICCGEEMAMVTQSLTAVNLMKAFGRECMGKLKFDLYADIAEQEGWHTVAKHFREVAENERWHALVQFKAYNKMVFGFEIESTLKNLEVAINGEHIGNTQMYPAFAKIAEEEGHIELARLINAIAKVEGEHEREFLILKEALVADGFFSSLDEEIWVCEICGHIHRGKKAPKGCPLCKASREYFKRECLI